ncbi:MAG: hypothetical protein EGP48_01220 [Erysipelatoclostridium ramosum]|nr:hypothetical protein [Thomasclavelia ramosa]
MNFLCKAMQKAKNGSLFFAIITFLFICTLLSCESNSTIISESSITVVGEVAHFSVKDKETISNSSDIVFTGNDIQWFNPNTREIKFKNNVDLNSFQTYQKIHFRLNNSYLFTAQTYASQHHSFIVNDLVLFIDVVTRKCYLHDCYPLEIAENDPDTKENKEKRADAWSSFLTQLKAESKVK